MTPRLFVRDEAAADLEEAAEWYGRGGPGSAASSCGRSGHSSPGLRGRRTSIRSPAGRCAEHGSAAFRTSCSMSSNRTMSRCSPCSTVGGIRASGNHAREVGRTLHLTGRSRRGPSSGRRPSIEHLAASMAPGDTTPFGQKYRVGGMMQGPNGGAAVVETAWIVLTREDFPRLVTAYPGPTGGPADADAALR